MDSSAFRIPFFLRVFYPGSQKVIFSFSHTQLYGEVGELRSLLYFRYV